MKKNIFVLLTVVLLLITGCGSKEKEHDTLPLDESKEEVKKINIIDMDSNTRPYAVVINNFPSAVKVQTGLSEAYLIYEFPVEGGMTRSLALYKDKETSKIGTVRSARHNFLDYVLENDAIFVHFGWSIYAEEQIPTLGINNINGLVDAPFWRENPEGLATEHTAYTSLIKCAETAQNKGYRMTTETKTPLNYSTEKIGLDGETANDVIITYSGAYKVEFRYDTEKEIYVRYVNGIKHTDYFTKEEYTAKNILVLTTEFGYAPNNYYLEIHNIGTGNGYYITNGSAKKITWTKSSRDSQTIYKYDDGSEVQINDGNTYIMFRSSNQSLNIS